MTERSQPSYEVRIESDRQSGSTVILGLSNPGFAGVTTVDYLVRHLDGEEIGRVKTGGIPEITPFSGGRPRNHTRVYAIPAIDATVVLGELFVPVWAASAFVDSVVAWAAEHRVEEIAIPYGVPYQHGPEEHAVFAVATDEFVDRRLVESAIEPLSGGVLDGVVGDLMGRSLNGEAPPTGAFVTPVHPPGPDLDAALTLLDALESIYAFDVDEEEFRARSADRHRFYEELADRMRTIDEEPSVGSRDYPADRSYM